MGSSGGSQQQQPIQTQTQTKDPWSGAQPFITQAMGSAAGLYNAGSAYQPYTGQTLADVHPWQQQGQNVAMSLAQSEPQGSANLASARNLAGNMVTNQGLNTGLQGAAGQFQDIYNRALGNQNPYLQDVINQQMNKVNAAMSGAGRYGSGAHDAAVAQAIAPTLAQDYLARQAQQQQATGSLADLYGQGLQRAGQYSQLIPTLDQARFANAGTMMDLGQFYSGRSQADLNSQIQQYNATQAFPWENLARYNAIVQGAGGLGGSQVTGLTGVTQQPTTMQRLFGGAAAGAGIGGSFGGLPGAGIGALGGGLLGLLG